MPRIPLIPNLSTKDGEANKNARMTNALSEKNPTGSVFCAVRPGLTVVSESTGAGGGLVEFNGRLLSVYGAELETPVLPDSSGGDPYWEDVTAAMHMDGVEGSTNIVDLKGRSVVGIQATANITTSQYKFGQSLQITGGFVQMSRSTNNDLTFGSDNFTIEMFVRFPVTGEATAFLLSVWDAALDEKVWGVYVNSATTLNFQCFDAGNNVIATLSSGTLSLNTWHHIAVTRDGPTLRLLLDGGVIALANIGTQAFGTAATSVPLQISGVYGLSTLRFNGFIDDLRITTGVARYVGPYTVPTEPFGDFMVWSPEENPFRPVATLEGQFFDFVQSTL